MNLRDDQQVVLSVQAVDSQGNPTSTGALTATSSDETVGTVADNGDGTFTAVTVGPLGNFVVTVSDDVDNDGTGDFTGSISFDVVPGDVAEIQITAGEPTSRV